VVADAVNDGYELEDIVLRQITSLCLDGQHISKLSGLQNLVNLRWASFNNNDITQIEVFYPTLHIT